MTAHTEHEGIRVKWGKRDEQTAKAATYVRKLGFISRASKRGIVRAPVYLIWGNRVIEIVV